MEQPIVKAIVIGFTIFLLVGVLAYGIISYNVGQDANKSSNQELNTIVTDMNEQKYLMYDNMQYSGSSLINSIKKLENDGKANKIAIHVKTGANPTGIWYYNQFSGENGTGQLTSGGGEESVSKAYDTNNQQHYINPSGTFIGKVLRDNNNSIRAIVFTQDNVK